MAPIPQEHASTPDNTFAMPELDGNRVVISGMSGLYPQCHNIKEFSDVLYNKINPVTSECLRFKYNHPEVVQLAGSIPDLEYFDAQFFKVHFRLANSMDPMARKVLEQSYQAIYDAGVNPAYLSGKKVGVYIGSCFSETEKACFYEIASRSGFGIAGCSKTMFANRISYWLNAKGPSMSIDEACCSSTAALEQAYLAMSRGECEAAIVGGTYLCLHPQSSVHYGRIIKLCSDGKTKSFDEHADGCAKSEAINVLFLQKAKDALRIYADVLYAKTEFTCMLKDETGPKYGFYRNFSTSANFINKFYESARIPPQAVEYVEAFGSALPEADKIELQAIEEVFCKDREDTLLIGSVMSNIGYGEAASGISAITKVLLGYHTGELAANLNFKQPRQDIPALREGRMRVFTDHQRFRRSYVAVNGMSITGVNSHVLLHGHYKPKDISKYKSNIPYLVTISGRHEEAVKYVIEVLKSEPVDPEQLALLHNIHRTSVPGHMGRGFIVLQTNEEQKTVSLCEKSEYFDDARKPLWFVYSGMGSQWAGMGVQLMRIPIFAAAIERCDQALKPKGLDIVEIITSPDKNIFNNILHSFVGIAAVQIGLTDILREVGLTPDGIIGHSVGELGCAYADGCLTAEEMILSAYYRGLVSLETSFIHGSMAAVGMGYEQISKLCPPEVEVACHNGPDSSTLSGPSDVMREFVASLTAKGIFAKEVPCSNIAYHSRYIADAGPGLLKYLKQSIKSPKPRSERWISSSVPKARWEEPIAKLCSAEYLTNNLLSPVLFEETSQLIPSNAVLVEIAPHGLLQSILKRSLPASCKNLAMTRRSHPDNTILVLEAIGKLFMDGYNSNVHVLYPKIEMPVATGTPFLSHMVKWAHGEKWPLPMYSTANRKIASLCDFVVALQDKEHAYVEGHSLRGSVVYPFAGILMLTWDTLAMLNGFTKKEMSVSFTDVELLAQPILHNRRQLKLSVAIHRGTGKFEVLDGSSKVVSGFVKQFEDNLKEHVPSENKDEMYFTTEDVYNLFRDRGYSYNGDFKSIACSNKCMGEAKLLWQDNWVTFIDGLFQLNALKQLHNAITVPTRIRELIIDVKEHKKTIETAATSDKKLLINAEVNEEFDHTRCGGILLENLKFKHLPEMTDRKFTLKALKFIPNFQTELDVSLTLAAYFQIVAENVNKKVINVVGVSSQLNDELFMKINDIVNKTIGFKVKYVLISQDTARNNYNYKNVDLLIVKNLCSDEELCRRLQPVLQRNQFLLSKEDTLRPGQSQPSSLYRVICAHTFNPESSKIQSELRLLRWGSTLTLPVTTTVSVRNEADLSFLNSVHDNLAPEQRLLVLTGYPSPAGLKELISYWRKESDGNKIIMVTVKNDDVNNLEEKLHDVELAFNVVDNGIWGTEFYLPVTESTMVNENLTLRSGQFADYDSLNWVQAPKPTGTGVKVKVYYVGLSNNDIKKANGVSNLKQPTLDNSFGSDFSGITESGQRVMGVVPTGATSSQLLARPELLWPVPAHWSLEDAATVPLAYAQAFYCLAIKGSMWPGMSILIHGGAGAMGQALISIALAHNCEVFTTVSDNHKKQFLLKLFPELKADHIGNSRDNTFADMIRTSSTGCHLSICCVKEELKTLTCYCTHWLGTVLDVSQIENQDNFLFGMDNLTNERQYVLVDLSTIFQNMDDVKHINKMISEGITHGYVRPLSRMTYAPTEVSRAFRLLAISQHRGRVLLRMRGNLLRVQQRLKFNPDHVQLVICNSIRFGLLFADRLIARGAKKLCLQVQAPSSYLQHKIRAWEKMGVKVDVCIEDFIDLNIPTVLNKAFQLGPLEGIYVTVDAKDASVNESLIKSLDEKLNKLCSDLRYFAVLKVGEHSIDKYSNVPFVCELPVTVLSLPDVKKVSDCSTWSGAVNAVEQALQSTHGVFIAHAERVRRQPLLQQIASIAGIIIPDNIDKSLTLQELGVNNHKLQLIAYFLQLQYNLAYEVEQVSLLSIKTILDLENSLIELPYENIKGLANFFNYVDSDELLATSELVFLPTLVNSASMREDEFEPGLKHVCIVPGMEGHHERFRVLCSRLKLPALVLQAGFDHPYETVKQTAERFAQVILKKTGLKESFYLMGYESGVLVALEIAAILEDHGLTGTVYCVGFSPEEFEKELEEQLGEYETEEQLQDAVLQHMLTLMTGGDTSGLERVLGTQVQWSQKIESCIRILLGRVSHSSQYAHALIECAFGRIRQSRRQQSAMRPLRSQIVLLRAATPRAPSEDKALQQLSQQPLIVHQLNTTLGHVAKDLSCAALINKHLDPEILEDFSNRNICDTYLLNPDSFMAINE